MKAFRHFSGWMMGLLASGAVILGVLDAQANDNVYISRFWHNHQPIYWPEWNGNGSETERIQYAWDSIVLKDSQDYGSGKDHPENDLNGIFGLADRQAAYQGRPRDSLAAINGAGGFAMSYSGSLMANVRSLGQNNQLGYGGGWWDGMREASGWTTPSGSPRLDVVGFTYHHSLAPLLPKAVLRKELQTFKDVWWKVLNKPSSAQSKGFFPTEMAFSQSIIDVLVEEGFEWSIVASHHLSRTCPTYPADPEGSFNIKSSPPNKADILGPSPGSGWWFNEPNPGQASWNVSPFAYQLHKAKYVNPETGVESEIILVPSDDTLSYQAGYSGAQIGVVDANIAPHANDANRPVIVMPATDGDNAWGGGYDSWMVSTPGFFGAAQSSHKITSPQDFVNAYGSYASTVHIEDGAWIFPVDDYGSPYFLKWIEPPLSSASDPGNYPGTIANLETPGFALKFWSWAPVIAGANWCETAEQILIGEGGTVDSWKIQDPYDWNGGYTSPNVVERAWHVYLGGLDSGFNYYGGLGNDDEVKQSLATRRAYDLLNPWMNATRLQADATGPTILKPQRFPYNPGAFTFGWFNRIPGGDERFLKEMPSEFYVWSHIYDLNDVQSATLKVRMDGDGVNTMANNQNETYAGGGDVGPWVSIPMTMRANPKTTAALNAAANNPGEINYFIEAGAVADYYFAKITDNTLPGFRGKLLDYYIEATDSRGNVRKTDIQQVWVEDDGQGTGPNSFVTFSADPNDCSPLIVTYSATNGPLEGVSPVFQQASFDNGSNWVMTQMSSLGNNLWVTTNTVPDNAPSVLLWFQNTGNSVSDNNNGNNWSTSIRDCDAPVGPSTASTVPASPSGCDPVVIRYFPNEGVLKNATNINIHIGRNGWQNTLTPDPAMTQSTGTWWEYTYIVPDNTYQIDAVFNDGTTWDNNSGNDWHFSVTDCTNSNPVVTGFVITNPPADTVVGNGVTTYDLQGVADNVIGDLTWTNSLTGGTGTLPVASPYTIAGIPLGVGVNTIVVSGTNANSGADVTNAADRASNYTQATWTNDSNEGVGFGPWIVNGDAQAGYFIDASGFGLWSHETNFLAEAMRPFSAPLAVGETFRARIKNGWIWESGGSIGMALRDSGGATLWEIYFNGGNSLYDTSDGQTDIGWTDAGLDIAFTLTGTTNYTVVVTPVGGSMRQYTGTVAGAVSEFRAWSYNNGTADGQNSNRNFYFDNLAITEPGSGSGSTTSDTVVITRSGSGGDADGDGIADAYETIHGGCSTCLVASADLDLDGASNLDEFIADTIPTNGASVYTDRIVFASGAGEMSLQAGPPTSAAREYDVFWSNDLLGSNWVASGLNQAGNPDQSPVMMTVTNPVPMRFYRTGVMVP